MAFDTHELLNVLGFVLKWRDTPNFMTFREHRNAANHDERMKRGRWGSQCMTQM
jgi:hypothetical protein